MSPGAYSGAGGLSGRRGFKDGSGGDKEYERVFLPLLTPPGAAVVWPTLHIPAQPCPEAPRVERKGEKECGCLTAQLEGSQHPHPLPTLPAGSSAACLPLYLTFAHFPGKRS